MELDRFSYCAAMYRFATRHHTGQNSPEYHLFGLLDARGYSPGLTVTEATDDVWREDDPLGWDLYLLMIQDAWGRRKWINSIV